MPKFAKGSPEAKAYMAYIRGKRGKKTKGGSAILSHRYIKGKGLLTLPFKPLKWSAKLGAKGVKQLIKMIKKKKEEGKKEESGGKRLRGRGDVQLPYNVGHLSSPGMYDDYSDFSGLFGFGQDSSRYNDPIKKFLAETAYLEK